MKKNSRPNDSRVFEDIAQMASGAMHLMGGFKGQFKDEIKSRVDMVLDEMDLVRREDFDAVHAMASKARREQEALAKRVAKLEAQIDVKKSKKKRTTKKK